jgi:hypothetical protein
VLKRKLLRALDDLRKNRTPLERRVLWFTSREGMRKPVTNAELAEELRVPVAEVERIKAEYGRESALFLHLIDSSLRRAVVVVEFDRLTRRLEDAVDRVDRARSNFSDLEDAADIVWVWLLSGRSAIIDHETILDVGAALFGRHRLVFGDDEFPDVDGNIDWTIDDLDRMKIAVGKCRLLMDMMLLAFRTNDVSADV